MSKVICCYINIFDRNVTIFDMEETLYRKFEKGQHRYPINVPDKVEKIEMILKKVLIFLGICIKIVTLNI